MIGVFTDINVCKYSKKKGKNKDLIHKAPHLTQETYRKVTTLQLDITKESQEVSPFLAGDHKASINRCARKHNENKTEITKMIVKISWSKAATQK